MTATAPGGDLHGADWRTHAGAAACPPGAHAARARGAAACPRGPRAPGTRTRPARARHAARTVRAVPGTPPAPGP
ncbi:hypothetical protein ACWFR1_35825 [Streptomyces sp. NPDC055103]